MVAGPGVDTSSLHANCLPRATLQAVREQIAESAAGYEQGCRAQYVAEVDGGTIGMVVFIRDEHPLHGHRGGVFSLVVSERYQGQGIARRLLERVEGHARTVGVEILELSCRAGTGAEETYRRLGFVEYGRLPRGIREPWGDNAEFDEVYLYKRLA